jgi:hypothetical protein
MITIFAKVAIRFTNPDPALGLLSKPQRNEKPEETSKRVAQDSSHMANVHKHGHLFFDTKPGEVQQAPDWILKGENLELFQWHEHDGNIMKVEKTATSSGVFVRKGPVGASRRVIAGPDSGVAETEATGDEEDDLTGDEGEDETQIENEEEETEGGEGEDAATDAAPARRARGNGRRKKGN